MSSHKGFTLLEIVISMALGLLLLAMVMRIYLWQLEINNTISDEVFLQENSRLALQIIGNEIRVAGFINCLPLAGKPMPFDPGNAIQASPNQLDIRRMIMDDAGAKDKLKLIDCNQVFTNKKITPVIDVKLYIKNNALYRNNVELVSGIDQLNAVILKPGVVEVSIHLKAPHGATAESQAVFASREE